MVDFLSFVTLLCIIYSQDKLLLRTADDLLQ